MKESCKVYSLGHPKYNKHVPKKLVFFHQQWHEIWIALQHRIWGNAVVLLSLCPFSDSWYSTVTVSVYKWTIPWQINREQPSVRVLYWGDTSFKSQPGDCCPKLKFLCGFG